MQKNHRYYPSGLVFHQHRFWDWDLLIVSRHIKYFTSKFHITKVHITERNSHVDHLVAELGDHQVHVFRTHPVLGSHISSIWMPEIGALVTMPPVHHVQTARSQLVGNCFPRTHSPCKHPKVKAWVLGESEVRPIVLRWFWCSGTKDGKS